jgi:hypothetical protein
VRVPLLLSPVLGCLSSAAFFFSYGGFDMDCLLWRVCYFSMEGLLFDMESLLSQFLEILLSLFVVFLLSLLVGYLLLFYQLWSIPCCPFLWGTCCSCLVMVYTLAKLSLSPYDRDQTLEV